MKRYAAIVLMVLSGLLLACTPQIQSIAEPLPVVTRYLTQLKTYPLPQTVTVTYRGGKTATRDVVWDLGGWEQDSLCEDIVITGSVTGT